MSGLRLALRERPAQRVDLSALTVDRIGSMSKAQVAEIELQVGNRTVRVDQLFTLAGEPGDELAIQGSDKLDRIGSGMTRGRIVVEGDAGAYLGFGLAGGTVEVRGSAGIFAGSGMRGGLIRISGSAGDFLGAAIPGEHRGMTGGSLLVGGDAGDRAGDRMRRGTVLIAGDAGDYCGSRMVAGTLGVWGRVGLAPGLAMRRGTLLLRNRPAELLPTFNDCGIHPLGVLNLMARSWRGLGGPFAGFPGSGVGVTRFMGDLANDGRGEILILVP